MSTTKDKAIAFMNEIHVAPGKRAKFMAKLRELGNDENALKTIMNDNEYIGHLMEFENQAIAYMNEIHLAQDKRAEFMAKFRELGGDQNALAEMVTYIPVVLKSAKEVPYPQQQYQDSSRYQHYASQIAYTQPKSVVSANASATSPPPKHSSSTDQHYASQIDSYYTQPTQPKSKSYDPSAEWRQDH